MRFIHTSDWQLGIRRRFLDPDAQARWADARLAAVRRIGEIAAEEQAELVVVAGDVFESNQLDRRTVGRALEAIGAIPVPVFLLPGNHDPLDPASIYDTPAFRRAPAHVHVLRSAEPVQVRPGLEVVGAPWRSKRPLENLVAAACAPLEPSEATLRICVGHGAVDALAPDSADPALIDLAAAERALAERRVHYLALGDRHSATEVGTSGRVRYAGTPEQTDYDEVRAGRVLLVELDGKGCRVEEREVGTWSWRRGDLDLAPADGVETVRRFLADVPSKARAIVRLGLRGALTLSGRAELDALLAEEREVFAAITMSEGRTDLATLPGEDLGDLGLSGFARDALEELSARVQADPADVAASDALALLYRLAGAGA